MPFKNKEDKLRYQREYQPKWRARRRAEYLADKCCVVCGSRDRLEIDHIDPSTKDRKSSSNIWHWSPARRQAELDKCQILCHTHHVEKTIENKDYMNVLPKRSSTR